MTLRSVESTIGRETSQTTPKLSMHLGAASPLATPANVRLARSGYVFGVVPGKAHRNIGKQPIQTAQHFRFEAC